MTAAVPVYRAVVLELERRRQQLGVSMERFSEFAGLPDRSYAKIIWPDGVAGRQAQWETVQRVVDALFPDGFDLEIRPRKGPELDKLSAKFKARFGAAFHDRKAARDHMRELGRKGALVSVTVRRDKAALRRQQRELGRQGGLARARRQRTQTVSEFSADSAEPAKRATTQTKSGSARGLPDRS
jgi:hypothetical protein